MSLQDNKYQAVKDEILSLLNEKTDYDDGSYGPVFVRLAWHSCGTWFNRNSTGGGCTAMLSLKNNDPANAGLDVAKAKLEPIKQKFDWISYADLWTLAGTVAIEHMQGPSIPWRGGRKDYVEKSRCPAHGRLPDAAQGSDHVSDVFCKNMGFTTRETVALIGCHVLGRCHSTRSGYDGKWVYNPIRFSNQFFIVLTKQKWTKRDWSGPEQFENEDGELMMLPTDLALLEAPWKEFVDLYAKDKEAFFKDFSDAFVKLMEFGMDLHYVPNTSTPRL